MPVETVHDDYEKSRAVWKRCRDVIAGQDAIHAAGERYLPRLTDQSDLDYRAYLKRALFFNATQRTVQALVGMVFRKPPMIHMPAAMEWLKDDATLDGVPLQSFAQNVLTEVLTTGRVGVMVDYTRVETPPKTVAEAERSGARAFLVMYPAESILNWKYERINGAMALTRVTLSEEKIVPEDDYSETTEQRLRVLILRNGVYSVEIFRPIKRTIGSPMTQSAASTQWELEESFTPMRAGEPLPFIPFVIFGADGVTPSVQKPPLLDMVDVNLSHYRTTADLEHGAHFCGLPTPVVSGYRPADESDKLYIGSTAAWVFPQPDARAYYLEFSGAGLSTLTALRKEKTEMMAALGARMLAADPRGVEAAETAAIHRAGEISALAKTAIVVGSALSVALRWATEWHGIADEAKIELSVDFVPMPMDGATLTALIGAWQQGAISKSTLFYNLVRGEIMRDGTTFEEEEAAISAEPPRLDMAAAPPPR